MGEAGVLSLPDWCVHLGIGIHAQRHREYHIPHYAGLLPHVGVLRTGLGGLPRETTSEGRGVSRSMEAYLPHLPSRNQPLSTNYSGVLELSVSHSAEYAGYRW